MPVPDNPPRLSTLILLTGLSVLSLNLFLPSLAAIADEFQTDYATVSLAVSGYLAATAVLQLIVGPLSDRFGRRPVMLSALVVFILGSVGCLLSTNIVVFLIFRILQAAVISGWVLSMAVIRDSRSGADTASQIGYVSMAMAVAPMVGPMLGGIMEELFGWRSAFLFFSLSGFFVFVLCLFDLGETNKTSAETLASQIAAYPDLLQSRIFWLFSLCIMFSTCAFYVFLAGIPLVAGQLFSLSSAELGFCMGTITAGFAFGSYIAGRYSRRFPVITMVLAGRVIGCLGLILGIVIFWSGYLNVYLLFGATVLVGIGNGITMPGASSGVLSVKTALAGSASGLSGALTVGGGAILTAITGAALNYQPNISILLGLMFLCTFAGLICALYLKLILPGDEKANFE